MYTTQGIILKKTGFGEADALYTIYTKDYGKIRARAQGVKKEGAKLKGHLETLNLARIGFILGKNGERLTHAELQNAWLGIRGDFEKLGAAVYMTELVDRHCLTGEKDEALWRLLTDSFGELEAVPGTDLPKFLQNFEIKLLDCLGYAGEKDIRTLGEAVLRPF